MSRAKKLWTTRVVGSKVVRIDPDVFRVLQRIAIESGLESATPAQVLRKVFEENDLMGVGLQGDGSGGEQRDRVDDAA